MDLIRKYFPELNAEQYAKIELLGVLYPEWNQKINVISRKDVDFLFEKHILHSLAIFKFYKFPRGSKIMDVGTGGGFPGIPLAIVNPEADYTLVDSIAKKILVVKDIAQKCELPNVIALNQRAEKVEGKFHFIVSRAVTNFPAFYNLVRTKISGTNQRGLKNGIIYLKGGDFREEIKAFSSRMKIVDLNTYFEEEFFITKNLIYLPHYPQNKKSN